MAFDPKQYTKPMAMDDDDDNFEEFDEIEWTDYDAQIKNLAGVNGPTHPASDHLWKHSWDDPRIPNEFTVALRAVLERPPTQSAPLAQVAQGQLQAQNGSGINGSGSNGSTGFTGFTSAANLGSTHGGFQSAANLERTNSDEKK